MMRVLQIANGYFGNRLYKNLFTVQEKLGIENTVYVPVLKSFPVPADEPENVIFSPCFSTLDRLLFFRKQRKMLQDLEKKNLNNFDILHAHTIFSGGYSAYRMHKKYGTPYIVAVRNTDVNVFFKYMFHLRKTGVEILRNAAKIVFLSPAYQEQVISKYVPVRYHQEIKEKSIVLPNGIAKLFLERKSQPKVLSNTNAARLIYVGEISSNKNLELTISAAEQLRRQGMDISITAVGAITEKKYQKLIEETAFLTHYDKCPQNEVISHLQKSDIFVMPSHTETFGLVYAEAMSQGLPVLYTRKQGFDGQFSDGTVGYAVSDTNPTELAEKIKQTISNFEKLSANCISLVEKFNWDSIAEEYKHIYKSMVSKGN